MYEMIEQRPTRREVLHYNGIRVNTQPLCPEFWYLPLHDIHVVPVRHGMAQENRQSVSRKRVGPVRQCWKIGHASTLCQVADETRGATRVGR